MNERCSHEPDQHKFTGIHAHHGYACPYCEIERLRELVRLAAGFDDRFGGLDMPQPGTDDQQP